MRILFLAHTLPYPPTWGFGIRVYQFLRLLARRHDVSILAYASGDDEGKIAALSAFCARVQVVPGGPSGGGAKRAAQFTSLFRAASYQSRYLHSDAMARALAALCAGEPFDVIQVESSQLAAVFDFDPRSRVVLDEHDIVYELLHRMYQTERSPLRRWYNWREFHKFKREEIAVWRRLSAVVTTSPREVPIIEQAAPSTPVLSAPNGVDVDYFQPSTVAPDADAIVMTGLMKTRPNIDAAVFFVSEVLPRILAAHPALVFYVVGGDPPDEVRRLASDHVVVTGSVDDVRPFVHRAAVFVVPMRMGGGTRLKVLEGLAMKKPMVSTSLGCEGIDVAHGEDLLVADEPAAFADAVLQLLDDRAFGARLAEHGHAVVHRSYRWEAVADRLEQFYEHVPVLSARAGSL